MRGARRLEVHLAGISIATRHEILAEGWVFQVKCPRTFCFSKDSFPHMLEHCGLRDDVLIGAEVVPFPLRLARVAVISRRVARIPYMIGYSP